MVYVLCLLKAVKKNKNSVLGSDQDMLFLPIHLALAHNLAGGHRPSAYHLPNMQGVKTKPIQLHPLCVHKALAVEKQGQTTHSDVAAGNRRTHSKIVLKAHGCIQNAICFFRN
jgi:hypothetical protein